jgi:hypothetical protein
MVAPLSVLASLTRGPRRRVALVAVVLGVLVVHGLVTQGLAEHFDDLDADGGATLARIDVAYVRDMALSAPPPTAAPAAPAPAAVPRARAPKPHRPAKPASAPASAPDEATEPDVAAASAPEPEPAASAPPVPNIAEAPIPASEASAPPLVAEAASAAASAPAAFVWPVSTRMSYALTGNYRGEVSGSAQVEWVRVGSHYQVHLDLIVGPSFAPIITRRMTSDGAITADGLAPRRFEQDTKVVMQANRHAAIAFEPGSVVLANGDRRASVPGVQDTASQFVQLTYVFSTRPELLRVGGTVDIPLALPHKVDVWTYDVVEEETLYTNFGPLPTIHLKPRRAAPRPGELSAEIWFAPQLRYLPVRIRIAQDVDTYVDLLIAKPPELGAP